MEDPEGRPSAAEVARAVAVTTRDQDGVITRRQLYDAGARHHDLQRMLRRRELTQVHPRVYVDHTGLLTWQQRAWAAALYAAPAALHGVSAVRAGEGPGRRDRYDRLVHVAVDEDRRLVEPEGVRIHRVRGLHDRAQWNLGPPRVRYDDAILDLAADSRSEIDAVAWLSDACGSRRTTVARLLTCASGRARLARRDLICAWLGDIATGTNSALEHLYLDRVERPHGLPVGRRQVRGAGADGVSYQDVRYDGCRLIVELDSQVHHDFSEARDQDLDRDLEAAAAETQTVRLGWGQVVDRPCSTAAKVGAVLMARGWAGPMTSCPGCRARAA